MIKYHEIPKEYHPVLRNIESQLSGRKISIRAEFNGSDLEIWLYVKGIEQPLKIIDVDIIEEVLRPAGLAIKRLLTRGRNKYQVACIGKIDPVVGGLVDHETITEEDQPVKRKRK